MSTSTRRPGRGGQRGKKKFRHKFSAIECANALEYAMKYERLPKSHPFRQSYEKYETRLGAKAFFGKNGLMVITGSQGIDDYLKFNLRTGFFKFFGRNRQQRFHTGFMRHASELLDAARKRKVKFITGHSLGAASAQLIASTIHKDALCFAAPKVLKTRYRSGTRAKIYCINRADDGICSMPNDSYKHIGEVVEMRARRKIGMDHKIKHYITAMNEKKVIDDAPIYFT